MHDMQEKGKHDKTFCDFLFVYMAEDKHILDKTEIQKVKQFIILEEYDTDSIILDIDIYKYQKQSNFSIKFKEDNDLNLFFAMKRFLDQYQC